MNSNILSLKDRCIIITGASSGIGKACAKVCAKMGAKVALFGRNEGRLGEVKDDLSGSGHYTHAFDITNSKELEQAISNIFEKMGPVSGFIHSAGIQKTLPLKMTNPKVFQDQYQVNVVAAFDVCRILQKKKYLHSESVSLIFIASINGVIGVGSEVAYAASKGAIISASKSLAIELAPHNIRVNCVSPGMVEGTQMTEGIVRRLSSVWESKSKLGYPLGWVEPIDVANAALFLLSDASRKITGTNLIVDGGFCAK